ncbi:MAG: sigma-70 family RNA polymerase sigma factor [Clostridia bacterium]|nr:sigma-70 family RNA polymerase sigma factor [Clostridia bacterium]
MDIDKIYREYFETVYKYLLYLSHNEDLAEELTQETFYKAIKNIKKFREESKLSTWLIKIAKNLYFDEIKRQKNKEKNEILEIQIQNFNECIEDTIVSNEEKNELKKKINTLDEISKQVVFFRISGELSFKEIGILLGKSENWARVTYYRAKSKLMKGVEDYVE